MKCLEDRFTKNDETSRSLGTCIRGPKVGLPLTWKFQISTHRCLFCGVPVTNRNLGGHSGKSALSGRLLCLGCADGSGVLP